MLAVGHEFRYSGAVRAMKQLLDTVAGESRGLEAPLVNNEKPWGRTFVGHEIARFEVHRACQFGHALLIGPGELGEDRHA